MKAEMVQQEYIDWFVDGCCDANALCAIVAQQMKDDLDMLDDEAIGEVKDYARFT